jgi:hypothetical protein
MKIDDLIIYDGAAGDLTGELIAASYPLGAKRIYTAWPTGAGSNTNWSIVSGANWSNVNENPPNDDVTYIESSVSGTRDSYNYGGSMIPNTDTPSWVCVKTRAKNQGGGTANIQGLTYSGSTYGLGDSKTAPNAYQMMDFPIYTDPATGLAWTNNGVNNAEFGVGQV